MRVKFPDQYAYNGITITSASTTKYPLPNLPTLEPGDAILPKGVGMMFAGGDLATIAAGLVKFYVTLAANKQDTPSSPFLASDIFFLGGFAYNAAGAGEGTPSLMEVMDITPLPVGLPATPAVIEISLVCSYGNLTPTGTLSIGVFLSYDIVTLTTAELARLIY